MNVANPQSKQPATPTSDALSRAINARHIAVFGASATPGKWGYVAVNELLKGGYAGELTLINPRGGQAFGLPLVDAEAARGADLAVIATPGSTLTSMAAACGDLEIPTMVCYASGFAEAGNPDAQRTLVEVARANGVRFFGPNCVGFSAAPNRINLTLDRSLPTGNVSIVSQSGTVGLHVGHRLKQLGGGFDVMMTLGNKGDIGFTDVLPALVQRDTTEAIVLYLERLDEGDAFLESVASACQDVPVVALLSGQTEVGRRATMSHTGSLVGNWERARSLLEDAGVLVCERLDAVSGAVAGARRLPRVAGRRIYVMCDGGGASVMMSDALGRAAFEMPSPSSALATKLQAIVDERAALSNPLDFAGAADDDVSIYSKVYDLIVSSAEYDAVVIGGIMGGIGAYWGPTHEAAELGMIEALLATATSSELPLVVQSSYATDDTAALRALRSGGIPCIEWPDEVANALTARAGRPDALANVGRERAQSAHEATHDPILVEYTERLVQALDARGITHALGTPAGADSLPTGEADFWVLRLDGIAHKTDAGAIEVRVATADLPAAVRRLEARGQSWTDTPVVRAGAFVPHDEELLVTFFRSASEGSGIVAGAGGTSTETKADVATGRLPTTRTDVLRLLAKSREGRAVLRAHDQGLIDQLADQVLALADLFTENFPELAELEINPIGLTSSGPVVLDVLPTVAASACDSHH